LVEVDLSKRNETKRNETKRNETKRKKRKENEFFIEDILSASACLVAVRSFSGFNWPCYTKEIKSCEKELKNKKIKTEKIIISFRQTIATVFTFVRAILGVKRYKKYVLVFLLHNFMITVVKGKN
jgi:hypothetical protein